MEANVSPAGFLWGFGICAVLYTILMWRVPKFREKVLGFKVFGKAMTKIAPLVLLGAVLVACTPVEAEDGKPTFVPEASAVGVNVAVVITWHPGTTDSIRFVALSGVDTAAVAQLARPFTEPQVDTMVLGARPNPGETKTWAIGAAYWWDDRGTSTPGIGSLGNVSYTEPLPAGTPPGFDPLPPPDTTASGPLPPGGSLTMASITVLPPDTTLNTDLWESLRWCVVYAYDDGAKGIKTVEQANCQTAFDGFHPVPGARLDAGQQAHTDADCTDWMVQDSVGAVVHEEFCSARAMAVVTDSVTGMAFWGSDQLAVRPGAFGAPPDTRQALVMPSPRVVWLASR